MDKGQEFESVQIGNQVWMVKNLTLTHFKNGDPIAEMKTDLEWKNAGINGLPAWCHHENDPGKSETFGKLYNWFAVNDSRGLAPEGWHIPTDQEWEHLSEYLGGIEKAHRPMKSQTGWYKGGNGTNASGFDGRPGGYRTDSGLFHLVGKYGFWWSSTLGWQGGAWNRELFYSGIVLNRNSSTWRNGYSVRCVRD